MSIWHLQFDAEMAARKASTSTEDASKSSGAEGRMTGKQYFLKNSNMAEEVIRAMIGRGILTLNKSFESAVLAVEMTQ